MITSGLLPTEGPACLLRTWRRTWAFLLISLALVLLLELSLGSVLIPPGRVLAILLGDPRADAGWRQIVLLFRLPRALTAFLAGAGLGLAGLQMQTLFRNPLADPSVLGVNAGASLGVALVILAFGAFSWTATVVQAAGSGLTLILASSLGSMAVMALVLAVARHVENSLTLLIVGLMVGYLTTSVVTILMSFALEQQLQRYVNWTFGSFAGVTWGQMRYFAPALALALGLGPFQAKSMNALLLGGGYARSLGVDVRRARLLLILSASVLAGGVTAYCGPIGFLGIAVPHLARLAFRTTDHHVLVPGVMALGSLLALVADLASQAPGSALCLPLNAVTALMGAPFVLAIVLRRRQVLEAGA
jgi:iron complex transport system permease protein